ncbi:hypothetical protein ACOKFD_13930 [Flagellimonas sp. S174]|uniref:hypothetical protein n=1 Tax=Flagellimonas sp. S174 TaxID=3410790 RepID=UPI003BF6120B
MNIIKFYTLTLFITVLFTACSDNTDDPIVVDENPLAEFNLLSSFNVNGHTLEVYSDQNQYTTGYNELFFRIKDNETDSYVSNATLSINPVMHMEMMSHSCPKSTILKTNEASVYKGFSIFQMPGNATEYWELNLEYGIDGQTYNLAERIEVKAPADGKKRVNVFTGSDETRYVLAMMPMTPDVKVNDFSAMLFKMENMMTFPVVEGYSIEIDPRMPGMGNHSSPNNEHLVFDASNAMCKGKLSLTMTGYWKINLKVKNTVGEVLKGEDVTEVNEASSLFFEMEF